MKKINRIGLVSSFPFYSLLVFILACDPYAKVEGIYKIDADSSIEVLQEVAGDNLPGRLAGGLILGLAGAADIFVAIEREEMHIVFGKQLISFNFKIENKKLVIPIDEDDQLVFSMEEDVLILHRDDEQQKIPLSLIKLKDDEAYKARLQAAKANQ